MTTSSFAGQPPHVVRQSVRLDQYATTLATILHFGAERTAEVVTRLGLTMDDWSAVDAVWTSFLAEAMRRRQADATMQFASAFFRARADLAGRGPDLASLARSLSAPVGPAAAASSPQRVVELPTYQLREQGRAARDRGAEPAQEIASSPVRSGSASPPAPVRAPSAAVAPPAAVPAPAPPEPAPRVAPAGASRSLAAARGPSAMKGTFLPDEEDILRGQKLPFAKGAPPAPPPPTAPAQQSGDTSEMETSQLRPQAGELALSVEAYARVTAQLASGADKDTVLRGAGLDDASWLRVATGWADRLRADPALMQHYQGLVRSLQAKR